MNCNKKSHFDGVTPVHRLGEDWGEVCVGGGFGYVSVCKEEELSQASEKEKEKRKEKQEVRMKEELEEETVA